MWGMAGNVAVGRIVSKAGPHAVPSFDPAMCRCRDQDISAGEGEGCAANRRREKLSHILPGGPRWRFPRAVWRLCLALKYIHGPCGSLPCRFEALLTFHGSLLCCLSTVGNCRPCSLREFVFWGPRCALPRRRRRCCRTWVSPVHAHSLSRMHTYTRNILIHALTHKYTYICACERVRSAYLHLRRCQRLPSGAIGPWARAVCCQRNLC